MTDNFLKTPVNKQDLVHIKQGDILNPTIDVVFKALFGEIGSENITARFLESILKRKITSLDLSR